MDQRFIGMNEKIAEWKKNVNGVIEGIKLDQENLSRDVILPI